MPPALTDWLTFATAALVLATAFTAFRTRKEVKLVHILVNSKFTAALDRIDQLTEALKVSDTDVPDEPV